MSIDYHPSGMSMWDTWCVVHAGQVHMFHLQFYGPNSTRDPEDANWIGHAVSSDLIHWTEQPQALGPGPAGSLDDLQPWTGCVYEHENRFYFFYTMRSSREDAYGQRIGLALSDDLETWTHFPHNPVIVPDGRYYIGYDHPLPKTTVDCRDMVVIPDPAGPGFLGFFATRVLEGSADQTAAIAVTRSQDLIHWEQLPPAFVPGNISAIEVPDVFQIGGRWFMTCLTGNRYGNRGIFSDSTVLLGTIYAVADRPEGPYHMIDGDNVLLGGQTYSGYSCRSVAFEGRRYTFYTQPVPQGPATVSPPMELRVLPGDRLRLAFSERAKEKRARTLIAPGEIPAIARLPFTQFYWSILGGMWSLEAGRYRGQTRTGWQTADLGLGAENLEFAASIRLQEGAAAGLVFRPDTRVEHAGDDQHGDYVFFLDAEKQTLNAARLPAFDQPSVREFPVEYGKTYHLRLCIRLPRFEVYVDDILVLQGALLQSEAPAPSVGFFVDRGTAEAGDPELYVLG